MHRPWTRLGTVAIASHVFYELAAGVAMPFASRFGAGLTAAFYGTSSAVAFREAGHQPRSRDPAFCVLNGAFLSAVITHVASWPRTSKGGLPWLTQCEGLTGRLMTPYNLILYLSGIAAIGGFVENRRGRLLGAAVPLALVPWLMAETPREFARLVAQAQRHPRWWNRRLQRR